MNIYRDCEKCRDHRGYGHWGRIPVYGGVLGKTIKHWDVCPDCNGRGVVPVEVPDNAKELGERLGNCIIENKDDGQIITIGWDEDEAAAIITVFCEARESEIREHEGISEKALLDMSACVAQREKTIKDLRAENERLREFAEKFAPPSVIDQWMQRGI